MKRLRALLFLLAMASSQILAPVAWAQAPAPPPPPPAPAPAPPSSAGPGSPPARPPQQTGFTTGAGPSLDVCKPVSLAQTRLPPTMNPPPDWRNRIVRMYADIRQDGSVADVKLVGSSGSDSLDAAALAQVRKTWRWAPLVCDRPTAGQDIVMAIPRARCFAVAAPGSRPQPPLALAQPRRGVRASVDVTVGQDGYVAKARISESSGNAALDAALLSHVLQTWRFWPLAEGCAPDTEHYLVRFPEADCVTRPIPASQTLPAVAPQRQTRAVDLQIVVAPDGKPLSANVVASSGDAGLDAAAIAHVKAAWRWEPIACKRVISYLRGTALPVMDMVRVVFPAR